MLDFPFPPRRNGRYRTDVPCGTPQPGKPVHDRRPQLVITVVILVVVALLATDPTLLERGSSAAGCFGGLLALWTLGSTPRHTRDASP